MKLDSSFFSGKTTLQIAQDLLGKVLVHKTPQGFIKGIIIETESYTQEEASSHSYNGETPSNEVMFKEAGYLYVYFTYGMHYCCNVVTEENGRGCAVLIRSVIPLEGEELMKQNRRKENDLCNGPAKLCQALGITKEHNGENLIESDSIYLEDLDYKPQEIKQTSRIGISKAQELKWRFVCEKCSRI